MPIVNRIAAMQNGEITAADHAHHPVRRIPVTTSSQPKLLSLSQRCRVRCTS